MNINRSFQYLDVGLPEDILRYKIYGDFKNAVRMIDRRLADPTTNPALAACMTAEREIILRMAEDFPYTKADAMEIIHRSIPDFTEEEFDERVDRGTVRWIYLDGVPHYFLRFFQTLVKTEPEFARRANKVPSTTAAQSGALNPLDRCMRIMKENGSMSCHIRVHAGIKADDSAFHPGAHVLACVPVPSACATQSEVVLEKIFPEGAHIDPEDVPQRTVWWDEIADENKEYYVEYSYVHKETYHTKDFVGERDPDASRYLCEQTPHIAFTPYLRNLVANVTEGIEEPYEKAKAIYDFITLNMHYTYMPEYFGMEQIAENCARSLTGDCGVFALLFITMCRIAGIPACWESGNSAEPDDFGAHDWARFYVEPCGWLYADTSYGISSHRVENEERRQFYFGNLDPYRMVANREFQADFTFEKKGWRCDPYDNQYGEIEIDDIGLRSEQVHLNRKILLHEEV